MLINTLFVFLLVLLLALFARGLALRGLRTRLSRVTRASCRERGGRGGGAGQDFAAAQGAREQLQQNRRDALVHQEADLEQEVQHGWGRAIKETGHNITFLSKWYF